MVHIQRKIPEKSGTFLTPHRYQCDVIIWSGLRDLNPRSPGPKPGAIPNFAKPGYSVEEFAVVVKYVVKEILPHFQETFKGGDWGKLGRNRGVRNISDSRTGLVLRLPNQARYQTSLSPDMKLSFLPLWSNMWSGEFYHIWGELSRAAIGRNWGETGECTTFWKVEPIWCSGSQSRRATNCATPGYFVIYPAGRVPPKQLRCARRRIPPKQLRCTRTGAFLLYHNAGKMQVGMARKMRAFGNL